MSISPRRGRRLIGVAAAVGLAGALSVVGGAPTASATENEIEHFCGSLRLPDDNGPVTDLLHHAVEDPIRPLGLAHIVHHLGCHLAGLEAQLGLR